MPKTSEIPDVSLPLAAIRTEGTIKICRNGHPRFSPYDKNRQKIYRRNDRPLLQTEKGKSDEKDDSDRYEENF